MTKAEAIQVTWHETHVRWRAVREVEEAIDADPAEGLPWNAHLAEVFGDRAGLLRALEYRWTLVVQAQLDPELPAEVLRDTMREVTSRHAGLLEVLERYRWHDEASSARDEGSHVVHV